MLCQLQIQPASHRHTVHEPAAGAAATDVQVGLGWVVMVKRNPSICTLPYRLAHWPPPPPQKSLSLGRHEGWRQITLADNDNFS